MCEELPGGPGRISAQLRYAHICKQSCAEPALGTHSAFLQISHSAKQKSREIKMTRGAGVLGHDIDSVDWTSGGRVGPVHSRIPECENG